jgi:hypothetical protein
LHALWMTICQPYDWPRRVDRAAKTDGHIYMYILDTQGLQSPASRTGLLSPMELTVANSATDHYSHYWAYSPCADHHKSLLVKSWFFCNIIFVYILNTQVLSHSARRTILLWPLKLSHYLRQGSVFIWRNSQSVHSAFHANLQICTVRSQNKVIF